MNPSFRPPPPLSDEYQNYLYSEIRKGAKTIGEISAEYNVSKARLEGIKKLKEIEQEFKRQVCRLLSLPIHLPYSDETN